MIHFPVKKQGYSLGNWVKINQISMDQFPVKKQGYSLGNWVKINDILNDPISGQKARLQSWELGENQRYFE